MKIRMFGFHPEGVVFIGEGDRGTALEPIFRTFPRSHRGILSAHHDWSPGTNAAIYWSYFRENGRMNIQSLQIRKLHPVKRGKKKAPAASETDEDGRRTLTPS